MCSVFNAASLIDSKKLLHEYHEDTKRTYFTL
jgi:hypothetical protein